MSEFIQGAIMLASFAVATFFLRYWRETRDRLFLVFSVAFALFGASRIALSALDTGSETRTWVYVLRAAAFLAIIAAILDKNIGRERGGRGREHEGSRHRSSSGSGTTE